MQEREQNIDVNSFARRHIGPNDDEVAAMLREVGFENLDALIDAAVPKNIRLDRELNLPEAKSETEALAELRAIAEEKQSRRAHLSAPVTPIASRRRLSSATFWKIPAGTLLTRLIRRKSPKADSKRCSISSR